MFKCRLQHKWKAVAIFRTSAEEPVECDVMCQDCNKYNRIRLKKLRWRTWLSSKEIKAELKKNKIGYDDYLLETSGLCWDIAERNKEKQKIFRNMVKEKQKRKQSKPDSVWYSSACSVSTALSYWKPWAK